MIKDNLRLVLSPNLTIPVSTLQNATSNHLNNCSIDFVKAVYTKIGDHKLLRKTVINISPAEYFQLKSTANSIDSFLQFIDQKNVKPTSAELDEGAQIQPLELPPPLDPIILSGIDDHLQPKQIAEEFKSREDILEIAFLPPYGRRMKSQYRVTFKKSDEFNITIFYV